MRIEIFDGETSIITPINDFFTMSIFQHVEECHALIARFKYNDIKSTESPQPLKLQFFTAINTVEKQEALRQAINSVLSDMNVKYGRHWIPVYIAYTYAIGKRVLLEDYSLFFADIEELFPGLLTNIDSAASGYDRYSRYVNLLSKECRFWFICNGKLPPVNEWMSSQYVYQVEKVWRCHVHELTSLLLKFLNNKSFLFRSNSRMLL